MTRLHRDGVHMEQNEWIYTINKYVVLSFSSPRCPILIILTSLFLTRIYIFFDTVQTQTLIYTRIHSPLWMHTRTTLSSWNLRSHHRHLVVDGNVSWHTIDASGSRLQRCLNAKEGEGSGSRDVERSMMHPQLHAEGINWRSRIEPARCECNIVWIFI